VSTPTKKKTPAIKVKELLDSSIKQVAKRTRAQAVKDEEPVAKKRTRALVVKDKEPVAKKRTWAPAVKDKELADPSIKQVAKRKTRAAEVEEPADPSCKKKNLGSKS